MPELYALGTQVNPLQATDELVVSDRASVDGTGYRSVREILAFVGALTDVDMAGVADADLIQYDATAQVYKPLPLFADKGDPTGFTVPGDANVALSFDAPTRTLTVTPASDPVYYVQGKRLTLDSVLSVQIADVEGAHAIWIDSTGTLIANTGIPSDTSLFLSENAFVAELYWDATNSELVHLGNEKHGMSMSWMTHRWMHLTQGAKYVDGLTLGNFSVDGSGGLAADAQCSSATGLFFDEDIAHSLLARAITDPLPKIYRSGAAGDWRVASTDSYLAYSNGVARASYNEWTGATWQLTEVTNAGYLLAHVIATNDARAGWAFQVVIGQAEYGNIIAARAGANDEINALVLSGLPILEWVLIGTVILQTSNAYSNFPLARVRTTAAGEDYVSWLGTEISPGTAPSSHANLTNRNDPSQHNDSAVDLATTPAATLAGAATVDDAMVILDGAALSVDLGTIAQYDVDDISTPLRVTDTTPATTSASASTMTYSLAVQTDTIIGGDLRAGSIVSESNITMTSGTFTISTGIPSQVFEETDAPTDYKNWNFVVSGGKFIFRVANDEFTIANTIFEVNRVGATVSNITVRTDLILASGSKIDTSEKIDAKVAVPASFADLAAVQSYLASILE